MSYAAGILLTILLFEIANRRSLPINDAGNKTLETMRPGRLWSLARHLTALQQQAKTKH